MTTDVLIHISIDSPIQAIQEHHCLVYVPFVSTSNRYTLINKHVNANESDDYDNLLSYKLLCVSKMYYNHKIRHHYMNYH